MIRYRTGRMLLLAAALLGTLHAAASERPPLAFERKLTPGKAGANEIAVDAALLTGARAVSYRTADGEKTWTGGLEDLRLYDRHGKEVPYLLLAPRSSAPRWRAGTLLPIAQKKFSSGFEVDFGSLVPMQSVRFEGINRPFLKKLTLEGSGDRTRWTLLTDHGLIFDLPEEKLARTEVDFNPASFRYLRVIWDDRASPRVSGFPRVSAREHDPQSRPAAARVSIPFTRRESEPGKSRFRLRLPGPNLPVQAIVLSVDARHLLRNATVTEPRLEGNEVAPARIGESLLRMAQRGELVASDLRIPTGFPRSPDLELVVEDGSNPLLPLTQVFAELAPLPVLYFESEDGQPLVARYGNPSLAAPRYDLEAMRQLAGRTEVPRASWGEVRRAGETPAVPTESAVPSVAAPIDVDRFLYKRQLPASRQGLTTLLLDAGVLAHSRYDLSDLRIVDQSRRQVPYVLERRSEPLTIPLPPWRPETIRNEAYSRYRLQLPYKRLPEARLVLKTTAHVFERNIRVEKLGDDQRRGEGVVITSAVWRHTDPETAPSPLVIDLPAGVGREILLIVDEGDNSPLPIESAQLMLPSYSMRFFRPDGQLTLLYGAAEASAPKYDLALMAPSLFEMPALELSLGRENISGISSLGEKQRKLFWIVLVSAVLILLLLTARLIKRDAEGT